MFLWRPKEKKIYGDQKQILLRKANPNETIKTCPNYKTMLNFVIQVLFFSNVSYLIIAGIFSDPRSNASMENKNNLFLEKSEKDTLELNVAFRCSMFLISKLFFPDLDDDDFCLPSYA